MAILEKATVFTDKIRPVPASELEKRLQAFRQAMDKAHPGWEMAAINHKIAMYYFTGTMQEGVLLIRPQDAILWVRRSYDRACNESHFDDIRPMRSFREAAAYYGNAPKIMYMEVRKATVDWERLLRKYFAFEEIGSIDGVLQDLRMVKSKYELEMMATSGAIHETVLDVVAPGMIRGGVSEAQLAIELYSEMVMRGSHGIARFNLPMGEEVIGIAAFGKSGLVRTAFDGPGGTNGTCIAVQSIGNAFRKLQPGRLVYLDIPCGFDGYHTDKTVVYYYGDIKKDEQAQKILNAQERCLELEQEVVSMMAPGVTVESLYLRTMAKFNNVYGDGFMNGGKFLGHSIGLVMDEAPAIAKGFTQQLQPGMVFAVEPKIALPGLGLVGTENTYVITERGAQSLTGRSHGLRIVDK
ncbi:Xaa-Pro peptidase family protein [uncultured Phascolarctobacterium sp.]|uniref:M24 family metallopeptidase n=1 Tax=uncultured Phascolarctobacterium sp. TaxID=512296 RepID=UPI0025D48AA6|nr:Xaa-Pro peptidase family protein [uncultured Phascolarctobacterium sp.]